MTIADRAPETSPPPADDASIVAALRAGDEAVFLDLVRELHRPLVRLAGRHVPSEAVAEEVVQDTWIAVINGLDRFEGRSSLRTWISRILVNQAKTRGERERRTVPMSALVVDDDGPDAPAVDPSRFNGPGHPTWPGHWAQRPPDWGGDAEAILLGREAQRVIADALATLPAGQRTVMQLRDVDGWSTEEVCDALGITAGNQRVLLHRARSRVRAALERYFADPAP